MKLYKLTDADGYTRRGEIGETFWGGRDVPALPRGSNPHLCTSDVYHAYRDADLALLLNPIQAKLANPALWECEGELVVEDWGKVGCFALTGFRKLPLPDWYSKKWAALCSGFAKSCAMAAADSAARSVSAAHSVSADSAARSVSVAYAAEYAARSAEYAAYAAEYAARADSAACAAVCAAEYAACAADSAACAADSAACAAANCANFSFGIDFVQLAKLAVESVMQQERDAA